MPSHAETRFLPFTPDQIYDLVADVAAYPQFIPWTIGARIRSVTPDAEGAVMLADLVVGFKMFRERFGSRVELRPHGDEKRISTEYIDGPFKFLHSNWRIREAEGGCDVSFDVDFEFKNKILQGAAGMFFFEAMKAIVRAFEARAEALYGAAT